MTGEFEALRGLLARFGPVADGEVWAGDDAAVLAGGVVVAVDPVVEGVHFLRSLTSLADAGWKALARNVSDVAAMGAVPWCCVASAVGADEDELAALYDGLLAAAAHFACPVVGGDLASGPGLILTVTALGRLPASKAPLLRSGARPGDGVYISRPLGWGAAGLRQLRADPAVRSAATSWYARPVPSVEAALAARSAGATAAIDISDGLAQDLDHLAVASGVGLRLDHVPVADGATFEEALHGGDEYHLAFTCPDGPSVPGIRVGTCTADPDERTLGGEPLGVADGWEHLL
ncbi:MAG TPA: thiamine-phosphate kinase [Acidimicrobiales bacterium]|nr:thiamine-phosphate kinase [Acidimicrobiales bacterium]